MAVQFIVADQDQNNHIGLKWAIEAMDTHYQVQSFVATSGELQDALRHPFPHILILEIDLFDDEQFSDLSRTLQHFSGKLIVFVNDETFKTMQRTVELQANGVIRKPVDTEDLKECIEYVMQNEGRKHTSYQDAIHMSESEQLSKQLLSLETQHEQEFSMLMFRPRNRDPIALFQYLQELESLHNFEYTLTMMDDCVVVVIHHHSTKTYNVPSECLNQWQHKEENPLVVAYFVSTGKSTYRQAYLACRQAFSNTYFSGLGKVLIANRVSNSNAIDFPYLTHLEKKRLLDFLQYTDDGGFLEWVKGWLYECESSYRGLVYTRNRSTSVIESLYHELDHSIDKEEETMQRLSTLLRRVHYADHAEEVLDILQKGFSLMLELQESEKSTVSVEIVKTAMNYMRSQYDNPYLTLRDVALVVDRNPSYLGQLFVQHEGGTFRQVLRDMRLIAAMKKLSMTRQSVKHLAFDVGYRDPNYFSRQFKDKTGLSPRAYRDEYKEVRP
ncbi:DNA-binding response regulator, AraC family [Geomicrobium sp. JCM 19037]|uniref:helix-turn-helix domain-containing protein n=1 Tax=Geomicrobium sp. JCM 19037 TaxID=1460634 RepID=UPI00045F3C1F|nr:helix-turn-helix domain-containing protein [Geomicrobium sp. JCM 19037]GAK02543.1 DNA-binding response regulator, AraC family [Geomicrobium sp. JCM 19037]